MTLISTLLGTETKTETKHFIIRRPAPWSSLAYGRHVRCIGAVPAWVTAQADETTEPYPSDPDATFVVDQAQNEADARMVHETMVNAVRPTVWLDSAALQAKIPAMTNPQNFALATSQLNFPRPTEVCATDSLRREVVGHCWRENEVDRWLDDMKSKKAQLALFV